MFNHLLHRLSYGSTPLLIFYSATHPLRAGFHRTYKSLLARFLMELRLTLSVPLVITYICLLMCCFPCKLHEHVAQRPAALRSGGLNAPQPELS